MIRFAQSVLSIGVLLLWSPTPASAQRFVPAREDTSDEIVLLRGKPVKGKILRIDGQTIYFQTIKRGVPRYLSIPLDSVLEARKTIGALKVVTWRKTNEPVAVKPLEPPSIRLPKNFGVPSKIDTTFSRAVEKDSLDVGAIDAPREETAARQDTLIDQRPIPLRRFTPEYPMGAQMSRTEGIVRLRLWIDREGVPRKYEVLESSNKVFLEPAVTSAMQWEFSPALAKGVPVGVWASISFEFRMQH